MSAITRYVGYIRVSDPRQVDKYSLEAQTKAIENYVASQGDGILVRIYADQGETGRSTYNREEFLKMQVAAQAGEFDVIVVAYFDRLGRNRREAIISKTLLRRRYGVRIISINEPGEDTDERSGAFIEGVLEVTAEHYSALLGAKVREARQEMLQQGKWYGHRPVGYVIGDDGYLKPHPVEADNIVRWLYQTYSEGQHSYRQLAHILNENGYRSSTGRGFTENTVSNILKNPLYIGKLRWQRTEYDENHRRKYTAEKVYVDGVHEPLVSIELWEKCQAVSKSKTHNKGDTKHKNEFLCLGIVYCAKCFEASEPPLHVKPDLWGKCSVHATVIRGKRYTNYRCREKGHVWGNTEKIDAQLVSYLLSNAFPDDWRRNAVDVLAVVFQEKNVEERLAELKQIMDGMDYRLDRGFITDMAEYEQKRAALQAEFEALKPQKDDSYDRAVNVLADFPKNWNACQTFEERRALVRLIVERVYMQDGKIDAIVLRPGHKFIFPEIWGTEHPGWPGSVPSEDIEAVLKDHKVIDPCIKDNEPA